MTLKEYREQGETLRRAVDDLKRAESLAANPIGKLLNITLWSIAAVISFNVVLILLAIPLPWVRRVIFHPKGAVALGLIVGKYLVIDPVFRFVRPIKMALFRDYRRNIARAPWVRKWENRYYIPQHLEVVTDNSKAILEQKKDWKIVFDNLLSEPTGRIWLLIGKSGLGKTALLEKWAYQTLEHREVPIFLQLGSDLSPCEEAAAMLDQYGDINVKPDTALDFLKGGGFVILLDGFNEGRQPTATREFVRQIARRNHVIMSSQVDPKWDRYLETSSIELQPFGREQLLKLMEEGWVNELLKAEYLSDLAELPHTAQLVADYINEHNRLPKLRLDIYRTLRKNFEGDTQILNLEATAWNLFKENRKVFTPDSSVPASFCAFAIESGILTKASDQYQFRHELIHRFFVACYLQRQDRKPLEEWDKDVHGGLGRGYWADTLELWSELFAERASLDRQDKESYYTFLKEAAKFSPQLFAQRLYPQLQRLYKSETLEKDAQFIEWAANLMAQATMQSH